MQQGAAVRLDQLALPEARTCACVARVQQLGRHLAAEQGERHQHWRLAQVLAQRPVRCEPHRDEHCLAARCIFTLHTEARVLHTRLADALADLGEACVADLEHPHLVRKPVAVTQNQVASKSPVFHGLNASN